ncbi:synaptotagmin-3-like isoform X2 [Raphanus sativus]|uniref:Synaptotagmin-3-like isoform X2 n=1 Tax=Raphanus sativus TaxID=3726 RepID=A0A6J0LEW9_RAPSA|nr:synaptotagmin-3-like isoform X2 [Raphanus sativus]
MWPYLDKAVCEIIRSSAQAIFAGYIGTFCIESIEFEKLSLPPTVHDVAVEREVEGDLLLGDMVQERRILTCYYVSGLRSSCRSYRRSHQ